MDNAETGTNDIHSALTLSDRLDVAGVERLKGSDNLLDTADYNNTGELAELDQQIEVHDDTFFRGVNESLVVNCVYDTYNVYVVFGSVVHRLKQLISCSADGDSVIVLLLERPQINFLDELLSDFSISVSQLLKFGEFRLDQQGNVVDNRGDALVGVLLYIKICG